MPLEADGIDVEELERAVARGAREARPRDPELPQPGRLHALRGQARAPGRARGRARLLDLRGRPLPRASVRATSRRRRCSSLDDVGPGDPRVLVLEDGQPGRARRLPRRPRGRDRQARQAGQRALHLAEHARRVGRLGALPLRRPRREHRLREGRAARAPRRAGRGASRAAARGRVRRPGRRLLPLADARRRRRHGGAAGRRARGGRRVRRRPRLHARGRALEPAALVRERPSGRRSREGVARIARALERMRAASPA